MAEEQAQGMIPTNIIGSGEQQVSVPVTPVNNRRKQPTAAELGTGQYCWGTGRRKCSVARVRIRPGNGKVEINNKAVDAYFAALRDQRDAVAPLEITKTNSMYDVFVNVKGGGTTGQAGAIKMGLARALSAADPDLFSALRGSGCLTRDSRMVERKKYGQRGARRRFQFSKR